MRLLRLGLRFWITLTSVFSFLIGWIILAHSPKPIQNTSTTTSSSAMVTPLPTLTPLNFDGGSSQSASPFTIIQPQSAPSNFAPAPMFRTGGS